MSATTGTSDGVVTTVHLVRHGEVDNPTGVLYGRLPGFHLSARGRAMAQRLAETFADRDIVDITASPMERAQETATPLAVLRQQPLNTDSRLIEAANTFQGLTFGVGDGSLRRPAHWYKLRNPLRPSWGEPYRVVAGRMVHAIDAARERARGHEALLVSHQLPVWIARSQLEGRRLWHDPRRRQCSLASVTSLTYQGDELVAVTYSEPARDLLPVVASVPGA